MDYGNIGYGVLSWGLVYDKTELVFCVKILKKLAIESPNFHIY